MLCAVACIWATTVVQDSSVIAAFEMLCQSRAIRAIIVYISNAQADLNASQAVQTMALIAKWHSGRKTAKEWEES